MSGIPEDNELDLTDDELITDPVDEPGPEDEPEPEDELDEDGEPAESQETAPVADDGGSRRSPSRSGRQIATLREGRRQQNEELAQLRREIAELRQGRQQPAQQQEDPRVEQERLALMSPEERMEYRVDRSLRYHQQQTSQMVFNLQAQQDKAAWDSRTGNDKLRSKLAADVEREYAACIARGQYLPRENIYTYLVGQRFIANRGKSDKATRRVERERVRPFSGRGDVVQERRSSGRGAVRTTEDFERRFGNEQI